MLFNTVEATATLLVGVDAFRNDRKRTSSRPRVISGIAIVGGNAIGECTMRLMVEDTFIGEFQNSLNGAVSVIIPDHLQDTGPRYVPPGSQVSCTVVVAPTVSPLKIQVFGREL